MEGYVSSLQRRVAKIFVRGSRRYNLSSIQKKEQFRAKILREKILANRHHYVFSLLLFSICDQKSNSVIAQCLIHKLLKRIRSTDDVGWFDNRRMGILLPYTNTNGAHRLAKDILQENTIRLIQLKYTVYTYPSSKFFSKGNENTTPTETRLIDEALKAVNEGQNHSFYRICKRIIDIIGALFGLIVFCPVFLLLAAIIKIVSPGPVFFKQQRIGYLGKVFVMYKFRTMYPNTDCLNHKNYVYRLIHGTGDDGRMNPMTKLDNDPQIIPFGRFIRKTGIDELPQFINVLRGDMSLVGPRPGITYEVEEYSQWHHERFDAVPGITGLWQVKGKNRLTFTEMMRLDIQYKRKMSIWLDTIILLKTPLAILSQIKDYVISQI